MNRLLSLSALFALGLVSASAAIINVDGYVPTGTTGTLGGLILQPNFSVYGQSAQNPCVIGDPSCQEGALGNNNKTLLGVNAAEYPDITSPVYSVDLIRSIVGNTFALGLDLNNTVDPQRLTEVSMSVYNGATLLDTYRWSGDALIAASNNGSGKSDANFFGFNLTSYSGTNTVVFLLDMPKLPSGANGVNDGREVLFLINTTLPPDEVVPEPSTYALVGGALLGVAVLRRRK